MHHSVAPAAALLGERIRQARIGLGLSQEAIAGLAGMHVTNFGKIERGRANPSLLTMLRIAVALGTDVATLTQDITRDSVPDDLGVLSAHEYLDERSRRRTRGR
ncbi:helix-turn-helix transcriptional regulator [Leifsonia shinshuensis]|uniref:helix-turn-helix domain-containing protein n=1 Tax=Leifsonia TaxID=110932 RepID=UPI002859E1C3|nr:helix-turn-helix transcriptional regulator [Leifsonia shinshuensis]MDR6970070.1 transcriptional regulator with XRE-family HTH domain [Leifsonia shinshuensis]